MFRLVLFDGFGTLFDSRGLWRKASRMVLENVGFNPEELVDEFMLIWSEEWNRIVLESSKGYFKSGFDVTVESIINSLLRVGVVNGFDARKLARLAIQIYKDGARLADGADETIVWLKSRGIKTGLVTDADLDLARTVIEKFGIDEKMDIVLISDVVRAWKPNPKAVQMALERLGVEPAETLMVGDSLFDVLAAKSAGVSSAWIVGELPPPSVRPNYVIRRIMEVKEIIRGQVKADIDT